MNDTKQAGLDVLNVGAGHLEIRFKETDVIEVERAKRIIQDMLKRGYSLFIPVGEKRELQRVKRFVATTGTYIIADGPTVAPTPLNAPAQPTATISDKLAAAFDEVPLPEKRKPGRPKKGEKEVPMTKVKATVVGRSAGG